MFSPYNLRAPGTGLNDNRRHGRKSVQFENACPNLGYPPPTNQESKNNLFGRRCNSTATLAAYIFRMKQEIDDWASALQTARGLLYRLKII